MLAMPTAHRLSSAAKPQDVGHEAIPTGGPVFGVYIPTLSA